MNVERLRQVRDAIASDPDQYDQGHYVNECGTPACIAGWAVYLSLKPGETLDDGLVNTRVGPFDTVHDRAKKWLGLTENESDEMFNAAPLWEYRGEVRYGCRYYKPAVQDALAMLDHAIETGEVVWKALSRMLEGEAA